MNRESGEETRRLSRIARRLPAPVFVRAIAAVYGRVEGELRRLDDYGPHGGTALDVGSWYGPWTRSLARRCDAVISFEPNPRVAEVLRRTVPENVSVIEAVAGSHPGHTTTLWVPPRGMGTEGVASTVHHEPGDVPVEVATTTVDRVVFDADRRVERVSFLKVDVEGAEQAVLDGATETLSQHRPPLVVELEYHRSDVASTLDFLGRFGYRGRVLVEGSWAPLDDFDLERHQERVRPKFATGGLLNRVLKGGDKYVNNVVFLAE